MCEWASVVCRLEGLSGVKEASEATFSITDSVYMDCIISVMIRFFSITLFRFGACSQDLLISHFEKPERIFGASPLTGRVQMKKFARWSEDGAT